MTTEYEAPKTFQEGPFANQYNAGAIALLMSAKDCLESRTRDRQKRAVEGTNQI